MLTFKQFKSAYIKYVLKEEYNPIIDTFFRETDQEPEYHYCLDNENGDTMYTASFQEAYERYLNDQEMSLTEYCDRFTESFNYEETRKSINHPRKATVQYWKDFCKKVHENRKSF